MDGNKHVRVLNDNLTTDFSDGKGTQVLSRAKYQDECKKLGRDPVGLTFTGLKGRTVGRMIKGKYVKFE